MSRLAFIFPGQGSQYVGMGKELYDEFDIARQIYEEASSILGFDLATLSFDGPEDALRESKNAQVAILVHSIASMEVLRSVGIQPSIVAGHSLGEYSALYCAGVFDRETVIRVVRKRGEAMSSAGERCPGVMCAVLGLDARTVEGICRDITSGTVVVANYNAEGQIVVSGEESAVKEVSERAKSAGARRVIFLNVSGAFHSPLMESALEEFTKVLDGVKMSAPSLDIVMNVTGEVERNVERMRELLKKQLLSPVQWVKTIRTLEDLGVSRAVECGPGKVLCGLVRRTTKAIEVVPFGAPQDLDKIRREEI